jgi:hypothetical protein
LVATFATLFFVQTVFSLHSRTRPAPGDVTNAVPATRAG